MFTESSRNFNQDFILDVVQPLSANIVHSLEFYYHIYGSDMGTLSVEMADVGTTSWAAIWSMSGPQQAASAYAWLPALVSVTPTVESVLRIKGTTRPNGKTAVCRCPFNQPTCDFATDLINTQGQSASQECLPVTGTLKANVYIYGNADVQTVAMDGITAIGSLTVVACPNLRTISAPAVTTMGNVAVDGCSSLESISMPVLSTAGLVDVSSCSALTSLDVISVTVIAGDLSIATCESLTVIDMPVLASVAGSLGVSGVERVSSLRLDRLTAVAGLFSIAGVRADAVTRLPCSARQEPWESQVTGTVEYSTGFVVACHPASSALHVVPGTMCDVCDVCVGCDSDAGTPVLLLGFVQFVPGAVQIDSPGAHVFECDSKFGCHGASTAGSNACLSDRYEGHFCASCVSGFQHLKTDSASVYECVECETADLAVSVLVLAAAVAIAGGISTLLWRTFKPTSAATTRALQAVIRSVWLPIRCIIIYAQVNSQLGDVLDVNFPTDYTAIMERVSSVLSITDVLVGSECAGLSSFFNKWLKDVVMQPFIMLGLAALYCSYEWRASGREIAVKHATGNAFFVVFFCCKCLLTLSVRVSSFRYASRVCVCARACCLCRPVDL
jgi:hypothetical protein